MREFSSWIAEATGTTSSRIDFATATNVAMAVLQEEAVHMYWQDIAVPQAELKVPECIVARAGEKDGTG